MSRKRQDCPIPSCKAERLLYLCQHLRDVHNMNSQERHALKKQETQDQEMSLENRESLTQDKVPKPTIKEHEEKSLIRFKEGITIIHQGTSSYPAIFSYHNTIKSRYIVTFFFHK